MTPMPTNSHNIFERFFWTFIAAGVGALPVAAALTGTGSTIAWSAALTAGIAAVLALAKNYLLKPPAFSSNKTLNVIERLAWTAIQAFVGSLPATINLTGHDLRAIAYSGLIAAFAAVISLAKNLSIETQPATAVTSFVSPSVAPELAPLLRADDGTFRPVPASGSTVHQRFATGSAGAGAKLANTLDKPPKKVSVPKKAARARKQATHR